MNTLVDPKNVTNFNLNDDELELHLLFWICAAGKNGVTAARSLSRLLIRLRLVHGDFSPFGLIRRTGLLNLPNLLKINGIGCFNNKSMSFWDLVHSDLDLKTCTVEDLEEVRGIGPKTARCFVMHSRPNQQLAGLDRHILRYLKDEGYDVPKGTPTGKKYKELEKIFLNKAKSVGKSPAELDLTLWNLYREK
jgi:hypothetical protein